MSKKKDNGAPEKEKFTQADYYRLNTKAVEDLVTASKENTPKYSEEELNKYRSGPKLKLAEWLKAFFIKFWFVGATCYFFLWGLSTYMADLLDALFVTGIALGIVTDLLTNNVLRYFEKTPGAFSRWMMFPKKGYASFPLNILYAFVVLFFVFSTYNAINYGIIVATHASMDTISIGVEPILFGLFYLAFDLLFLQMKRLFQGMVRDASKKTAK